MKITKKFITKEINKLLEEYKDANHIIFRDEVEAKKLSSWAFICGYNKALENIREEASFVLI